MENYFPTKIQLFKPVEELEFTDDYMFCTILEEHKDICKEIIELLLNIKVNDIEYVNKQLKKIQILIIMMVDILSFLTLLHTKVQSQKKLCSF